MGIALLVLFDVDGTLLLTRGASRSAMQAAGERVVGPGFSFEGVPFAGRLDPLIWADAVRRAGVRTGLDVTERFRAAYAQILEERLRRPGVSTLLPGVLPLLGRLEAEPGVTLGLVTGNYPETGSMKLRSAGLDPARFPVRAWGTDGSSRRDLPRVALARYRALTGAALDPARAVVVGDTVHDVDCARANGCRALAVASGPGTSWEALAEAGPDLLVPDLLATEALALWIADGSLPGGGS